MVFLTFLAASILSAQTSVERPFWRPVVMGTHGMVAAEHPLEAIAGMRVLEAGGNAIDAAVAVFYMTSVVEQHQAGVGGDGFILAYIKEEDRVVFINGTGPAPAAATRDFYRELGKIPNAGPYSTDVPGAVGGFDLALSRYGTMSYQELLRGRHRRREGPSNRLLGGLPTRTQHQENLRLPELRRDSDEKRTAARSRRALRPDRSGAISRDHR